MIRIETAFLEHIPKPLVISDAQGNILWMNSYTKSYLESRSVRSVDKLKLQGVEVEPDAGSIRKCVRFGDTAIETTIFPITYEAASCFIFAIESYDLSDAAQLSLDEILEHIDDAVCVVNRDGMVEKLNDSFTRLSGIDRYMLIGRDLREVVAKKIISHESISLKVLESGKPMSMNVKYKTGKYVTWTSQIVYDKTGKIAKVVSTGRDITELVNLEEEFHRAEKLKDDYYNKVKEFEKCLKENKIIFSSDEMKRVILTSVKAAKPDSPVFIWGESGVGKELIANLVHKLGNRNDMLFIAVNCAVIPSELLESELFGYEEGAFTGAKKGGKKGLFEEAHGGTLFLDEIGELPITMQSKLLRVLQENEFMRIGGNRAIPANLRVISATNLTTEQLKDRLKFRQDLFYRLNVIPIYIPPLRERRDDIFPLVHYFLRRFNAQYNATVTFSKGLMVRLYHDDWPGNVRELKNVVERLVILSESDQLNEGDYDAVTDFRKPDNPDNSEISITKLMPLREAVGRVEETLITMALEECHSIVGAAQVLKIDPSTIHRKIKKGCICLTHLRR